MKANTTAKAIAITCVAGALLSITHFAWASATTGHTTCEYDVFSNGRTTKLADCYPLGGTMVDDYASTKDKISTGKRCGHLAGGDDCDAGVDDPKE